MKKARIISYCVHNEDDAITKASGRGVFTIAKRNADPFNGKGK